MGAQGLSAGGQHPQMRTRVKEPIHQLRRLLHEVFAVVQHQKHLFVRQGLHERVAERLTGTLWHLQSGGHGLRDQITLREPCQPHQPHPIPVDTNQIPGYLQGQSRLARTSGSCEGKEPCHGQQTLDLDHLPLTSNEAGPRGGQVVFLGVQGPLPWRTGRRGYWWRELTCCNLVTKPATRSSWLRTDPPGQGIAEPLVLGEGPLGPTREGVKTHKGYMRLLGGWLFGRHLTQHLDGQLVLVTFLM